MEEVEKVEEPTTLNLKESLLSNIKDWEVGKKYKVALEVEVIEVRQGNAYDPKASKEIRINCKVLKAQAVGEMENNEEETVNEEEVIEGNTNHSSGSFIRMAASALATKLADKLSKNEKETQGNVSSVWKPE